MKKLLIIKFTFGLVLIMFTISFISCNIIKSQIIHHTGGDTEIVDPSKIKTSTLPLAITNVNILSTDCKEMLDNLTILIKKGEIIDINKNNNIPKGFKVIDGTGQYLIPGLIDTHTHLQRSKNDLLLFLANGVTHISIMNSTLDKRFLKWRQEAKEGSLSPEIYIAAGGMSTKKGLKAKIRILFGDSPGYNTPSQARKAVIEYKNQGYDAIKSYNANREVYFAIAAEAKSQNIPMIGHLAPELTLKDLYNSGQSQLSHVEEITKAAIREFGGLNAANTKEFLIYFKKNADKIAIKLREKNITISTTIWLMESIPKQKFDLENLLKTIELEYQNPGQIEGSKLAKGWLPGNNHYENLKTKNNPERREKSQIFWKAYVDAIHIMTKALVKNNVTIIAGTDSNTACTIAGFSLHDELESLNKSGLTKSQVLYSATCAPAKWMKSNTGKIKIGYRADLVLLTKNPLEDINNTRSINSVITNGKLIERTELDKILQLIKEANNRSRKVSIDKYLN